MTADHEDATEAGHGERVCHVYQERGSDQVQFSRETAEKLLAGREFFWLDLKQPTADDFVVLREVFRFHPLAVEDSEHFGEDRGLRRLRLHRRLRRGA